MTDLKDLVKTNQTGKVKWFNVQKGIGFIVCEDLGEDVFVHYSDIIPKEKGAFRALFDAQSVIFDLYKTEKGFQSLNVRVEDMTMADAER